MKCRIWLPYGKKAKLASYFGVSSETVRKALAFECGDNDFHEMIRKEDNKELWRAENIYSMQVCRLTMITKKATGGMNMNRLSKQCMVFIAGMISFLYVLGLVGHQDYIEEILYNMPQETYDVIVQKLGNVSRSEIAAEYEANRAFYDNLNK